MNIYFYAHTGHRVGMEHLRRMIPLVRVFENELEGWNVVTLVNDVRARSYAKECGLGRVATIDGVQDIANIVNDDDVLVFSSEEPSEMMLDEMRAIYPSFVRFDDTLDPKRKGSEIVISPFTEGEGIIQSMIIDTDFCHNEPKKYETVLFMGDSDYSEESGKDVWSEEFSVLMGHYFSLDLRSKLEHFYKECIDEEMYIDVMKRSRHLVTGSIHAACECVLSGGEVTLVSTLHSESILKSSVCEKLGIEPITLFDNNFRKDDIRRILDIGRKNDEKSVAKYIHNAYWIDCD